MMTPFERVVGDSSKDHTVTAPTFTTRPTTEQLHHYAGRHFGISRDDAEGAFLSTYIETGVVAANPFSTIDVDGVGGLVELGAERGRATSPGLRLGVCGEHGGDPNSIAMFERLGLDYVSCSPYRVPIARFAAAQAAILRRGDES